MIGFSFGAGRASKAGFDPATLSLTGWWRASYSGSPWTPTASAGSSGSNGNLAEGTNPPATGTAVNGYTPADFDGTNDKIDTASGSDVFSNLAAWTVVVLFNADSAAADSLLYLNPSLWTDTTGGVVGPIVSFSDAGVEAGHYDGAFKSVTVAASTGSWHLAFARYNGTNIEVGVDSGSLSSVAAGNVNSTNTAPSRAGTNYNAGPFYDGKILEIMTADTALTDGDRANIRSYVNARYGLSL